MKIIKRKDVRLTVLNKYDGKCAYCGCELTEDTLTVDHIKPKRRGASELELKTYGRGKDKISNFNPCCLSCNSSKCNFSIDEWKVEISKKHDKVLKDNSNYRTLNRFNLITVSKEIIFYFEKH